MTRIVDGGVVYTELPMPGSNDTIVLLDPDQLPEGVLPWHPFFNLLRVAAEGEIVWRAPMVSTDIKSWLSVRFEDHKLYAGTWSWDCELDPNSGRIVNRVFTK